VPRHLEMGAEAPSENSLIARLYQRRFAVNISGSEVTDLKCPVNFARFH